MFTQTRKARLFRRSKRRSVVAAMCLLAAATAAQAQTTYWIKGLSSRAPGGRAFAYGLNDNGVVVGQADAADGLLQPVRWIDGAPESIILPPPPGYTHHLGGRATAVNADGRIIGNIIAPGNFPRAYTWQEGAYFYLPLPFGFRSQATDINTAGVIVGHAGDATSTVACRWWFDGTKWRVETLDAFGAPTTVAEAIDDDGVIYGAYAFSVRAYL